jgi:monoamine oxidase
VADQGLSDAELRALLQRYLTILQRHPSAEEMMAAILTPDFETGFIGGHLWRGLDGLRDFLGQRDGFFDGFAGGAQQLCERMAAELGDSVVLGAFVSEVAWDQDRVAVAAGGERISARRALITLAPTLAGRIRYQPGLPADRDHLTQRLPMGWIIKVHCVYPARFWAEGGLAGKVVSDDGAVRASADNSPPSGTPGILAGFIEGDEARRLARASPAEQRDAAVQCFARYFGEQASEPLVYHEHSWGDDAFARGAYGGYWTEGVWTAYGHALRAPIGPLRWAGTETSTACNGKLEGAVHSGVHAAAELLEELGARSAAA